MKNNTTQRAHVAKRTRKAALYNPYLDTLGGGEKYTLSILQVLDDLGFHIDIYWDEDLTSAIKDRLNIEFKNLTFVPNIFKSKSIFLKKLTILKEYEIFFYITDGSYFISSAKKNFVYAMVPDRHLYSGFLNKIKLLNWRFITHSRFTQKFLAKWGITSDVLYSYLSDDFLSVKETTKKEKIILTVGRFFTHLHAKKHDEIIKVFKSNKQKLKGFKLVLAGGLKQEDQEYFAKLKMLAGNDPDIVFKPNLPFSELLDLYKKSLVYWHFAGFGIDEEKNPEAVEHFGLTPLEAMSSGCMTFVYGAGGPAETIIDGENGFVFQSERELIKKTLEILSDEKKQNTIRKNALSYIKDNFSYDVFRKNVVDKLL